MDNPIVTKLNEEAVRIEKAAKITDTVKAKEEEAYDNFDGKKVKVIPTPKFCDCPLVGTLLPINMANEVVTNLSKLSAKFDFVDFIKEKLKYTTRIQVCSSFSSEQVDALVLAIKSFEKGEGFILGDMAGIGKGRVCAGVLRYCHNNNVTPIFVTLKDYLFSDIYRDISDIGGFGDMGNGKKVKPQPLILNDGYQIIKNNVVVVDSVSRSEKIKIYNSKKLPKEYNCIFLTYSQLNIATKREYITDIANKSILIFDESHTAASSNSASGILKASMPIVQSCKGILFASATFAKTHKVFQLYVEKTALKTAIPSIDVIMSALKVGGENVSEYIASGLVAEGQMIRRERSFDKCEKVTEYVDNTRSIDDYGEIKYELQDNMQRKLYDEAMLYFRKLKQFAKSKKSQTAIENALQREFKDLGFDVITKPTSSLAVKDYPAFIQQHQGKWVLESYTKDNISHFKASFRDTLFLSVKAKFAADKIIECLTTNKTYSDIDGTIRTEPQKPVIAIRNTGETMFNDLNLKEDSTLENKFSEYIQAVYNRIFYGNYTLRKVTSKYFDNKSSLKKNEIANQFVKGRYKVEFDDYEDGGNEAQQIQSMLNAYSTDLPFSVIDYLRDRINSTKKPFSYKWGKGDYFRCVEATGRSTMIVKDNASNKWVYKTRIKTKDESKQPEETDRLDVTTVFKKFNNGDIDVMILNTASATGGSAQSSPKEGVDTRQRNMFIIQFELDINVEVQKRGRVNRTGQLNFPTYTYIISIIPAEIRQYLMFRKKLRKLDANTSANQTASSETSELPDSQGNIIEDILNGYGFDCFKDSFIELPEHTEYNEIYKEAASSFSDSSNTIEDSTIEQFQSFVRELEIYPCQADPLNPTAANQEYFFNKMNQIYIDYVAMLKTTDSFHLELSAKNYKAALKERVVVSIGSGSSVFSMPMFLADYYTLETKKAWTKEMVQKKMNALSVDEDGTPVPVKDFYDNLIKDILDSMRQQLSNEEAYLDSKIPVISDYDTFANPQDEYDKDMVKWATNRNQKITALKANIQQMKEFVVYFKPDIPVFYNGNLGKFVGYKNTKGYKYKYSAGSLEFIFCFLSEYPVLHLKATTRNTNTLTQTLILKDIMWQTDMYIRKSNPYFDNDDAITKIRSWIPNYDKRIIKRFLTDNILSGVVYATAEKSQGNISSWVLSRFTTVNGSIETAIELNYSDKKMAKINAQTQSLSIAASNDKFIEYLDTIPEQKVSPVLMDLTAEKVNKSGVIWNTWDTKNELRSVCIMKRMIKLPSANDGGTLYYVFQFIERAARDKNKKISDIKKTSEFYRPIFHDKSLYAPFKDNVLETKEFVTIDYAVYWFKDDKTGAKKQSFYNLSDNGLPVFRHTLIFSESEKDKMSNFLSLLYSKYDTSFDFNTQAAGYYNIEEQPDTLTTGVALEKRELFPTGRYVYRFTDNIPEETKIRIPNVIEKTSNTAYGEVVTEKPLDPFELVSYSLIPNQIPNDIIIKLLLGALGDRKFEFVKKLDDMQAESDFDIGNYANKYLIDNLIAPKYFFGDASIIKYGNLLKEYTLNNELTQSAFSADVSDDDEIEPKKEVTYDDAENFLIALL